MLLPFICKVKFMRIGVDVGGTNTDAVLMDGARVAASHKTPTTANVSSGIVSALEHVLSGGGCAPGDVTAVMIGTTHFTNAVVERRRLLETAAVRLALPANTSIPPMADWPSTLRNAVGNHAYLVHGGNEFNGRIVSPLDERELREVAADIRAKGIRSAALTSIFSPVTAEMEERAAEILLEEIPDLYVTLSSDIGRIGLLERENAAILNASLCELAQAVVSSFRSALDDLGIRADFYVSQNDGTLMGSEFAEKYPILTFASGPTNSMRGAALLSGVRDAVVVDIGGTTSDVGVLVNGFPREASTEVDIGEVRTNFRMPDIISIGLGGGSIVRTNGELTIGPDSVGYELPQRALVFGGDTLTTTDIAVAAGLADIGDPKLVAGLDRAVVDAALAAIQQLVERAVDRIKTSAGAVPVVLVGGGTILVADTLAGASELIKPEHAAVANAMGAAIAQAGGEIDRVFSLDGSSRDEVLDQARAEATARAVAAGAEPTSVTIVEVDEIPLTYLPGNDVRIRVKAVGDLQLSPAVPA
jgi:N-methylhydantoinase A/oxoprolinase/acetone carboxylase beta subunit